MFGDMFGKIQQMQQEMQALKSRMSNISVAGESAGGQIKVSVKGNQRVESVEIGGTLNEWDKEELEDLIMSATNKAFEQVTKIYEAEMGNLAKQYFPDGVPPGLMDNMS
ncbi:MAG: YbaB/EbfC family nucleoid-associated protein [Chitinophagaceae bacterium]|nr:MAG: YbaB/EbfC family nucleoid-associated protein [Chitinophagaceae bacterium]